MDWFTKDTRALESAKAQYRIQKARAAVHGTSPFDGPTTNRPLPASYQFGW